MDLGHGTNNEAEYRTLIHALEDLLNGPKIDPSNTALTIRSDSAIVVNQLQRLWKVKSGSLRPLFQQASNLIDEFAVVEFIQTPRSEIRAVLGH
jgi:ribonuclease HI